MGKVGHRFHTQTAAAAGRRVGGSKGRGGVAEPNQGKQNNNTARRNANKYTVASGRRYPHGFLQDVSPFSVKRRVWSRTAVVVAWFFVRHRSKSLGWWWGGSRFSISRAWPFFALTSTTAAEYVHGPVIATLIFSASDGGVVAARGARPALAAPIGRQRGRRP